MLKTEDENDNDDEEMRIKPATEVTIHRYESIQTNPEEDVIQIHTDGEISQCENIENKTRRSNRHTISRINTVVYHILEVSGVKQYLTCYRFELDHPQGNTTTDNHTQASRLHA